MEHPASVGKRKKKAASRKNVGQAPESKYPEGMTRRQYRNAVAMFCLAIVMYFVVNIQRVAVPGQIFDALQAELGLSASAVSAMGTAFMYVYAATQLAVGLLVDKYGGMRVLATGSILMAIGAILFPLADNYWLLVAGRVLVGLGCGATFLSVVKEMDRLFPQRFALVMGIAILIGYIGATLGTMPLAKASQTWGWRPCMMAVGVLGAVALLAIGALWRFTTRPKVTAMPLTLTPFKIGFANRYGLIQLFSYTINYGIYFAILTVFGKKFLEDAGHLSSNVASLTSATMMLLPAIANQVVGILTTCAGNRRRPFFRLLNLFPLISTLLILFCLLGHFNGFGYGLIVAFILISLVGGFTPVTSSLSRETNPPEYTGTAVGIINFGAYIMTAIGGTISGLVLDWYGGTPMPNGAISYPDKAYITIFAFFALISLGTFIISLKMPETYGKNIYKN